MTRLTISFLPAVAVLVAFLGGALLYRLLVWRAGTRPAGESRHRPSVIASAFFIEYVIWLAAPLERWLVARAVSPHALTLLALALAAASAALVVTGFLGPAAWVFVLSGIFDLLDGRVARRSGRITAAGAFLDSVTDRWSDFLVLSALVVAVRHSPFTLAAALLAMIGSQMVSYTRARAEALGVAAKNGTMQRPERTVLLTAALLTGEFGLAAHSAGDPDGLRVMAALLLILGVWSTFTAVQRLLLGVRALDQRDSKTVPTWPKAIEPPPAKLRSARRAQRR